jgi:hypothetical protein
MLIDEPRVIRESRDPILMMIGDGADTKHIRTGVYEISHFGSSAFLRDGYEHYPELSHINDDGYIGCYGVCDGIENLLEVCPMLESSERQFVVTLKKVTRDVTNRGKGGGWRWHKWGAYIGAHVPECEYLDDEMGIESVFVYHIFEKV